MVAARLAKPFGAFKGLGGFAALKVLE